jgi:hypothetical protein
MPVRIGFRQAMQSEGVVDLAEVTRKYFDSDPSLLACCQRDIVWKCIFCGDLLADAVWNNWIVIDAVGKLIKSHSPSTEVPLERIQLHCKDVANGLDSDLPHAGFGDLAHAGNTSDRKCLEEGLDLVGLNHKQAVGLLPI